MLLLLRARETFVIFTILLTYLHHFQCFTSSQPIFSKCSDAANYTTNSNFEDNLNVLLSSLTKHGRLDGFYNNTIGENPNRVFGLVLCRGDVSADDCHSCIETARTEIIQVCPMTKTAIIWYDYCLLRYSSERFFSSLEITDMVYLYNLRHISTSNPFILPLNQFLMNLSRQALRSPPMFAIRKFRLDLFQNIYGMVQCSRDLSRNDCNTCLMNAIYLIPSCCYRGGGRVIGSSCNLRFETYTFLNSPVPTDSIPQSPRVTGLSPSRNSARRRLPTEYIIAIVVSVITITIMLIAILATILLKRRKEKENNRVGPESGNTEPLSFDLGTIVAATSNFSEANKIREGSFGHVYKGTLFDGRDIAVKRLSWNSGQGLEQLKNEVALTAKLEHKNIVRLLGFCMEGEEKLLVYEYVSNNSLDHFLFDPAKRGQLVWDARFTIIKGIAQGLSYLHKESPYKIVHQDLKVSNIFLDSELNPKISEFSLARLFRGDQTQGSTISGTDGYMAPEDAMRWQFSVKSDVFSFGVIVLEIVSGRKSTDFNQFTQTPDLLSYTWKTWGEGKVLELMDPALVESCSITEVLRCIHIGLLCVQEHPGDRPTMSSVNMLLNSKSITQKPNSPPMFFMGNSPARPNHPSS